MNKKFVVLLSIVLILFALPTSVSAYSVPEDKVVLGGNYTLSAGETLNDNLVIFGGSSLIESGATVKGNITIVGGSLDINGTVTGNIIATGGSLTLGDTCVVDGNVSTYSGTFSQGEGALIKGSIRQNAGMPLQLAIPTSEPPSALAPITSAFNSVQVLFWFIFQSLALAAVAMLIALLFPKPLANLADATGTQPAMSGGLGILTILVAPIVLLFLTITLILIPVAVLAVITLVFGLVFGWIGFGTELGILFTRLIKQDWHIAISAGLGTLVLTVVLRAIAFIPCVGWIFPFIAGFIGLGAVILTRVGTQSALPMRSISPTVVVPPTPPTIPPQAPVEKSEPSNGTNSNNQS